MALLGTTYLLYSIAVHSGLVRWTILRFDVALVPTLLTVGVASIGLGLVSMFVDSCPARQHVRAAQGQRDALFYLIGFYVGIFIFQALTIKLVGWIR